MNDREILRLLRRKKFAVLVQWKQELESKFPLYLDAGTRLPPRLLFRSFDEVVGRLKRPETGRRTRMFTLAGNLPEDGLPPLERYLEVFLTGEQVLGDFIIEAAESGSEPFWEAFVAFQSALYAAFHEIIRRELALYRTAAGATVRGGGSAVL